MVNRRAWMVAIFSLPTVPLLANAGQRSLVTKIDICMSRTEACPSSVRSDFERFLDEQLDKIHKALRIPRSLLEAESGPLRSKVYSSYEHTYFQTFSIWNRSPT